MKIVADPNIPFVQEAFQALGEIALVPGREISAADVREADVLLVRSVTNVSPALLEGSRVKFVATATIGFDHVDRGYLEKRGIGFASAAGCNANSVGEYIVAALLELARRQKSRLAGRCLGVVGVGNVGTRVARYAEALGMRVLRNDPPRQRAERSANFVTLDQVLAEADMITLHVPLIKSGPDTTFHLFDKERLHGLNIRRPILLNSSRGPVIDNGALAKAINGDWLGGVVLDVWENEPEISPELLEIVDVGTPHIAGYSFDGKVNGTRMIYEAVCGFFGRPATWQPVLPPPVVPRMEVKALAGEPVEDVLRRVISGLYDINADDARLRSNLQEFDKLRAQYPIRREFFNTELVLCGGSAELRQILTALGFRLAAAKS